MIFTPTPIDGAWLVDLDRIEDERGFFARAWSPEDMEERGLSTRIAQISVAWNERAGTLRGLHFQHPPHTEVKVVRCTRGAIWDVIVDLRSDSPAFRRWFAAELTEENRTSLCIPEGCAHGYQTLVDGSEVTYLISYPWTPSAAAGYRWDDPAFAIDWPEADVLVLSEKDRTWPDFDPAASPF
jgi:dTDP-4-dehydrorhamnose 3,5-epimerase